MCIKKLKQREFRKQNTHYKLDNWELWNTEEFDSQVHHFKQSHILILLPKKSYNKGIKNQKKDKKNVQ